MERDVTGAVCGRGGGEGQTCWGGSDSDGINVCSLDTAMVGSNKTTDFSVKSYRVLI